MKSLVVAALSASLSAWALLRAAQAYRIEWRSFHPRRGPVSLPAGDLGGLESVAFGAGLHGWWIPAKNGAAVVLLHGAGADRAQMLPEARLLAAEGFGVLLYDSPGHGESEGRVLWGEPEQAALRSAVDFVARRPAVGAIGGLGFSMGAYVLARVAPSEPRLAAVVLESCFADSDELTRWEHRRLGPLTRLPAFWAQRRAGFVPGEQPVQAVAQLSPRPVLFVSGADDGAVTPAMARRLYDASRLPRELWLVPGAGHGGFAEAAAREYPDRLAAFFRAALSVR